MRVAANVLDASLPETLYNRRYRRPYLLAAAVPEIVICFLDSQSFDLGVHVVDPHVIHRRSLSAAA